MITNEVQTNRASISLKLVIGSLVSEASRDLPLTLTPEVILDRAKTDGMLEVIVGFADEPKKALGWAVKKLRGRRLIDSQGRAFEFGRREMEAGAKYPITFL